MLLRRYACCKIRVLGKARDEKHEATRFDLEFREICAACWNACMFAMPLVSLNFRKGHHELLRHRLFMCLQNAADPLESIMEWVLLIASRNPRYHQTRDPFIENEFSRIDDLSQLSQHPFDFLRIRNQEIDDLRPSFVQTLIPDAGRKESDTISEVLRSFTNIVRTFVEQASS